MSGRKWPIGNQSRLNTTWKDATNKSYKIQHERMLQVSILGVGLRVICICQLLEIYEFYICYRWLSPSCREELCLKFILYKASSNSSDHRRKCRRYSLVQMLIKLLTNQRGIRIYNIVNVIDLYYTLTCQC